MEQQRDLHGPTKYRPITDSDQHVPLSGRSKAPRDRLRPWYHQRESSRLHAPQKHPPPSKLKCTMHVAFLDLGKCFDTISHEDLVIVMRDVVHLPLEWVEVIRRQ